MDELGNLVGNPPQHWGTTATIDPDIKHSYTDSTSLWLEHELFKDVGMRIGYTYKTDGNNSASVEQNRVYSLYTSQVRVDDPGRDGLAGNSDDGAPFIVYEIPTTPAITSRTITSDGRRRSRRGPRDRRHAEPADAEQLVGDDELPLQLGSRSRVRPKPESGPLQRQHGYGLGVQSRRFVSRPLGHRGVARRCVTSLATRSLASSRPHVVSISRPA